MTLEGTPLRLSPKREADARSRVVAGPLQPAVVDLALEVIVPGDAVGGEEERAVEGPAGSHETKVGSAIRTPPADRCFAVQCVHLRNDHEAEGAQIFGSAPGAEQTPAEAAIGAVQKERAAREEIG